MKLKLKIINSPLFLSLSMDASLEVEKWGTFLRSLSHPFGAWFDKLTRSDRNSYF